VEYELASRDGKLHGVFGAYDEAVAALREEEDASPGITEGWLLITFDADGNDVGNPELAEDLLAMPLAPTRAVQFVMLGERVGLFIPVALEGSSGTATPTRRGFRRPPSDAMRTLVPSEG
jgi:hypothetical protein